MRWPDRTLLIAGALGAVTVAGFAPLYFYPLPIFTLAALMWLWSRAPTTTRRAFAIGWWFGLGFFLTGVSWVYVSLNTFGAMPAPLAAFFTLLFCAFLALFPALTGYVYAALRVPLWMRLIIVTPAVWTLGEWVRGWIFTGFPWLALGYSQVPASPLAGHAPVVGIFGVSLITMMSAGAVLLLIASVRARRETQSEKPWLRTISSMALLITLWVSGYALKDVRWTEPTGEPTTVTLLQGNIAQDIKWTAEGLRTTLLRYRDMVLASRAKLIVFPETAIPLFLRDIPQDYLDELADHARDNGGNVLLGVPERAGESDYYNSVISLGASTKQVYRKSHLVPFGEFIPLRPLLGWIVSVLAIPLQDFSRGSQMQQPLALGSQRVAVNICYEDAFGEEIIRQLPAATLLANVSNVAWFGRSVAPSQHLQISQARALETGRYMIRATNTGMTGVIDERGRVLHLAAQFETAAVTASVQGYTGATPYVRIGNAPVIALCVCLLLGSMLYAGTRRLSKI
ncbi:MAG: apolipoprotein N-acyltransferase [Pseudomonadota bacterium]